MEEFKTLICQKCGKEFKVGKRKDNKGFLLRKYCDNCNAPAFITKQCKYCGKDFIVYRSDKNFYGKKVCDDCLKPKTIKTLICQKCGKKFTVNKTACGDFSKRKYCDNCSKLLDTKILICKKCGKSFEVGRYSSGEFIKRDLCDNCLNYKENIKTLICQKCGKEFKINRNKSGNFSKRKYCDDCLKKKLVENVCQKCGKLFLHETKRKYCDDCLKLPDIKTLICQKCGKEFTVKKRWSEKQQTYYFSIPKNCPDCNKPQNIKLNCQICGKEFQVKIGDKNKYKYCDDCRSKGQKRTLKQTCQEKYGIDYPCLLPQVINSNKLIHSKINQKFEDLLNKNDITFTAELKIDNYIYDIALIEQKIFIEINPTISHTDIETGIFDARNKYYHLNKTKYANENNYHCIHVWDWDDWGKIIQLVKPKEKLYARKLELEEIDKQVANIFLDKYHLQNSCYSNQINLGLFDNDRLVQVMTFGKPRYNKNYQYELLRLCSHSDYIIVGGAEKLFKYFVDKYQPESVISYCDISKFTGDVYNRLGFKQITQPQPREHWSKNKQHITAALLNQKGYDKLFNTNYGKGTNNRELMLQNGWLSVWDCGQVNFVWNRKHN